MHESPWKRKIEEIFQADLGQVGMRTRGIRREWVWREREWYSGGVGRDTVIEGNLGGGCGNLIQWNLPGIYKSKHSKDYE